MLHEEQIRLSWSPNCQSTPKGLSGGALLLYDECVCGGKMYDGDGTERQARAVGDYPSATFRSPDLISVT